MAKSIENLENAFDEMFDFITDLPSGLDGFESDFDSAFEELRELKATLTPPNEPLTPKQLREMNEPVWCSCKPIEGGNGYWCLCRYGKIVTPSGNIFDVDKIPHWMFYRRPPEGEEDA